MARLDFARIDKQLEQLLLLDAFGQEVRLDDIGRDDPASERTLRRLIELTRDAHTDHIQSAIQTPTDDIAAMPMDIPGNLYHSARPRSGPAPPRPWMAE